MKRSKSFAALIIAVVAIPYLAQVTYAQAVLPQEEPEEKDVVDEEVVDEEVVDKDVADEDIADEEEEVPEEEEELGPHDIAKTALFWFPQEENKTLIANAGQVQGYTNISWKQDVQWDEVRTPIDLFFSVQISADTQIYLPQQTEDDFYQLIWTTQLPLVEGEDQKAEENIIRVENQGTQVRMRKTPKVLVTSATTGESTFVLQEGKSSSIQTFKVLEDCKVQLIEEEEPQEEEAEEAEEETKEEGAEEATQEDTQENTQGETQVEGSGELATTELVPDLWSLDTELTCLQALQATIVFKRPNGIFTHNSEIPDIAFKYLISTLPTFLAAEVSLKYTQEIPPSPEKPPEPEPEPISEETEEEEQSEESEEEEESEESEEEPVEPEPVEPIILYKDFNPDISIPEDWLAWDPSIAVQVFDPAGNPGAQVSGYTKVFNEGWASHRRDMFQLAIRVQAYPEVLPQDQGKSWTVQWSLPLPIQDSIAEKGQIVVDSGKYLRLERNNEDSQQLDFSSQRYLVNSDCSVSMIGAQNVDLWSLDTTQTCIKATDNTIVLTRAGGDQLDLKSEAKYKDVRFDLLVNGQAIKMPEQDVVSEQEVLQEQDAVQARLLQSSSTASESDSSSTSTSESETSGETNQQGESNESSETNESSEAKEQSETNESSETNSESDSSSTSTETTIVEQFIKTEIFPVTIAWGKAKETEIPRDPRPMGKLSSEWSMSSAYSGFVGYSITAMTFLSTLLI